MFFFNPFFVRCVKHIEVGWLKAKEKEQPSPKMNFLLLGMLKEQIAWWH